MTGLMGSVLLSVSMAGIVISHLLRGRRETDGLVPSDDECRLARITAGLVALVTVVLWAFAVRTDPPFSAGQKLGHGFLIGGILGAMMCLVTNRLGPLCTVDSFRARLLTLIEVAFAAVFGVALVLTIFSSDPADAMVGYALGSVMASILGFYARMFRSETEDYLILTWCLVGLTAAAGTWLAVAHFATCVQRHFWPLPVLIITTALVACLIAQFLVRESSADSKWASSSVLVGIVGAFLTIAVSCVYAWQFGKIWKLLEVVAFGNGALALCAWVILGALTGGKDRAFRLDAASLSAVIVLAFAVAEFKLWSGLGIAIGLAAAWTIGLPTIAVSKRGTSDASARTIANVLSILLAFVLFRLFITRYQPVLSRTDLHVHYSFVGAILGVVIPFLFASSMHRVKLLVSSRQGTRADICALRSAGWLGVCAVAAPLIIYLVWQLKAAVGFMFGSTASLVFFLICQLFHESVSNQPEGRSLADYMVSLFIIAMQLSAIQFIRPFIDWSPTRLQQLIILSVAVVVGLGWFALTGIAASRVVSGGEGTDDTI